MERRLFIAVEIPTDSMLIEHVATLQKLTRNDKIKWVELHNLHITLRFIGETPESLLKPIIKSLQNLSETYVSFECTLAKLGIFGSSYNPRVIWLGISGKEHFQALSLKINQALQLAGIEMDSRPFVPHLTLGRINQCNDKNNLREVVEKMSGGFKKEIKVEAFHLIESKLTPKGPIYTKLHSIPLK
ncbi:MAG: RNA 2',3'-cyclic phosphodiesterase [Bacteroidota bacterium]